MNPTIEALIRIYERDLNKLEEEIRLYPDEALMWKVAKGINNSGGNLCLHLCGNLQYYFGTVLGQTGYKRNRPLEFSAKDVPLSEVLKELQAAKKAVAGVLSSLTTADLDKEYPEVVFDKPMTTVYFLIHLASHLGYHLGQINYHRRLLTS
jgi:hypothetical protein